MKSLIAICLILSCGHAFRNNSTEQLQGFAYVISYAEYTLSGKMKFFNSDTTKLYSYKNIVMYRIPYRFDSLLNNRPLLKETRYHYFVYAKDSSCGYNYDPMRPELDNKRYSVDSIDAATFVTTADELFKQNDLLLQSTHKEVSAIHEIYLAKSKVNATSPQSTVEYFYAKRSNDPFFSLSKQLDSIKEMKLYKVYTHTDSFLNQTNNTMIGAIDYTLELQSISVDDQRDILSYLHRYLDQVIKK
ncbi:MAG: hypothetical protein JWN78_826 [Bacteroidota bacterium]|nr:hypothetical protein [Bacteroidota bacterium]